MDLLEAAVEVDGSLFTIGLWTGGLEDYRLTAVQGIIMGLEVQGQSISRSDFNFILTNQILGPNFIELPLSRKYCLTRFC